MNSDAYDEWVKEGTDRVPWKSVAGPGRPWFLRSKSFKSPDGDYTAGCWLTTDWGWNDGLGFRFNDDDCDHSFDDYLCEACPAGRGRRRSQAPLRQYPAGGMLPRALGAHQGAKRQR